MIGIDGTIYNFPCDISRKVRITSSDVSGMLMDRTEYNDALATYIDYTLKVAIPIDKMNEYTTFFEQLASPVDSHTFYLPYNQTYLNFKGKIDSLSDVYFREVNGVQVWRSVAINIKALEPSKKAERGLI
jgi:hypothetical protein